MKEVKDKVAFITGGASGMGFGMVRAFLEAGMKVVIADIRGDHIERSLTQLQDKKDALHGIELDVTDRQAMAAAADETEQVFGKVHLLCNNAGLGVVGNIKDSTYDDWDWLMSVNLGGVINGVQTFLPRIRQHGEGGHIMATSSMSGIFSTGTAGIYTTAKYAVCGMMESLRAELRDENIGVSVMCPGAVNTNIFETWDLRPEEYSDTGYKIPEAVKQEMFERMKHVLSLGMDPLEVGRKTLRGIQRNDLFILTHPEFEQGIRDRFEAILASLPDEAPDPARVDMESRLASTLRNPVYIDGYTGGE